MATTIGDTVAGQAATTAQPDMQTALQAQEQAFATAMQAQEQDTTQASQALGEALGQFGAETTTQMPEITPEETQAAEDAGEQLAVPPIQSTSDEVETLPAISANEFGVQTQQPLTIGDPRPTDAGAAVVGTVAATEPPQVEVINQPQMGTDRFSAMLRSVGQNERRSLSEQSTYNQVPYKQKKKLADRRELTDHYDITIASYDPKTGTYEVEAGAVGGVADGKQVGTRAKKKHKITNKNLQNVGQSTVNYAATIGQRDPLGQITGTIDYYYDMVQNLTTDPAMRKKLTTGRSEFNAVIQNYNLYQNWGRYNNFQRFRNVANTMITNGRALGYEKEINAMLGTRANPTGLGAAVNGLGVLNFGYSTHQLLENWSDLNEVQRTAAILNSVTSGIQAYQGIQGIATYATSAGAAGATATAGAAGAGAAGAGAAGAGAAGAGAAGAGTAGATAGTGASAAGGAGGGAAGAAGATTGSQFVTYLNYAAAILAAYNIVDQWGTGGAQGRANGAANGAAIGTAILPGWGTVIGAAVGVAIGSINTGKSTEQGKRDYYRAHYRENELFERVDSIDQGKSDHIQLADGSFYDVGIDGSGSTAMFGGQAKTFKNPDQIAERDRGGLMGDNQMRPYEVDYTSDLDFSTHLATKGLNLLLSGGSIDNTTNSEASQMNGYLTNAATSNLSSREFNEENFKGAMANVRQFYSKMNINSKAEGIEIANALYQSGRMSKSDFNSVMIGLEMAFGDNFEQAQGFMGQMGRATPEGERAPDTTSMEDFKAQEKENLAGVKEAQELNEHKNQLERLQAMRIEAEKEDDKMKLASIDRRIDSLQNSVDERQAEQDRFDTAPGV